MAVIFAALVGSIVSGVQSMRGNGDAATLQWYVDMSAKEDEAYKVYFAGDATAAEAALTQLLQYLDSLPQRSECQVARYTDRAYVLTRLEFVRAFRYGSVMDFKLAVDSFATRAQILGSPPGDPKNMARKLVEIVRQMDGPRVPWASEKWIAEAVASVEKRGEWGEPSAASQK
jgi:hypothetical protein